MDTRENVEEGWSAQELASYDQALAEKGHLVMVQKYREVGDSYEPIDQYQIPKDYLSFTLVPRRGEKKVAHILVLDPKRVDYKLVGLEHLFRTAEGKAEDEEQRERLKNEGYQLVLIQFPETDETPLNLIAVRTKIPDSFNDAFKKD